MPACLSERFTEDLQPELNTRDSQNTTPETGTAELQPCTTNKDPLSERRRKRRCKNKYIINICIIINNDHVDGDYDDDE